jgi:hypothetical protein
VGKVAPDVWAGSPPHYFNREDKAMGVNYLSAGERAMLESTLFNLRYDMDCIGEDAAMRNELAAMSDTELERTINSFIARM